MKPGEIRHRVIQSLLQAEASLTYAELAAASRLASEQLRGALEGLVREGLVVTGNLVRGSYMVHYRWAARWQAEVGSRAGTAQEEARAAVDSVDRVPEERLWLDSPPVIALHRYVIDHYEPPSEKRFLVFFQCSVRRPFSKSPSHSSMRRAIAASTGFDPARDFERCPVHVVVLAGKIGPVPYELEDMYPANVRGGGVKDFGPAAYQAARPVLSRRMAEYIQTHSSRYEAMWAFTDGRYADIVAEAARLAAVDIRILPDPQGPGVLRLGKSVPRTYWQKFWIQLCLEIVSHLDPGNQAAARDRLRKLNVTYH